jgi:serine protease Do
MYNVLTVLSIVCAVSLASAETVELVGGAVIRGEVLRTKVDTIVVDIGYRVLEIPTDAVVEVADDGAVAQGVAGPSADPDLLFHSRPDQPILSVEDNLERVSEAVVQVRTPTGLGSGFVIHEHGYVVTNQHVISGEHRLSLTVFRETGGELERLTFEDVRIVAADPFIDLALLAVRKPAGTPLATVPLGESGSLRQGETVFAVGSPLGLDRTVSRGIVSLTNRVFGGELYVQTTTAINPGNSGGPLFNLRGEVVAVSNLKIQGVGLEGLSFAIPVDTVRRFVSNRSAFAFDPRNPNAGFRYHAPPRPGAVSEEGP